MKPPPFLYVRPTSIDEACALLAEPGARVLAGGQSLVPMLTARTVRPDTLVDLAGLAELALITVDGDHLVIGAMVRQHAAETSELVREHCPLLIQALGHVAHPQVRSQGTVVGSIAHAEPAAELPAVLLALDGEVVASSEQRTRTIAAKDFFVGPNQTALRPDELATHVRLPVGFERSAFVEESRRHNDLPLLGVAAAADIDSVGHIGRIRLATCSAAGPMRLREVELLLTGARLTGGSIDAGLSGQLALAVAADLDEAGDRVATGAGPSATAAVHRRRLAPVLIRRAIEQLFQAEQLIPDGNLAG